MRAPIWLAAKMTATASSSAPGTTRQPPAVRFEAEQSNACWQFDMSPSDLKHLETPDWIDPRKGQPMLMLFSVVDDRSGVSYMEYCCVYGEDAESALRFLFMR